MTALEHASTTVIGQEARSALAGRKGRPGGARSAAEMGPASNQESKGSGSWSTLDSNEEYLLQRDRETQLALALRAGDRDAFQGLYELNVEAVGRFVSRRCAASQVDDVVAEVFLRAWKARDRFEPQGFRYLSWLLRIAQNLIISQARRPIREDFSLESAAEPQSDDATDRVVNQMVGSSMRELLGALPERQRVVLELRFVEDLSSTEVGEILGISGDAVRQLTVRSLKQVRSLLGTSIAETNL
jgi:RNA polymerase sigma factor (sigma-70 family)